MSTKFRPYSIIETTPSSKVIKNYQTYLDNNRLCWIVPISEFQDGLSNNLNIDVRTISNNYLNSTLYVVNPGRTNLYYNYCQGTSTHEGTSWEFKVNNTNLNRYYSNIQSVIQEAISAGYNYIYLTFQWNNSVLSQTVADFITGYDASTKFIPLSVFEVQPDPTDIVEIFGKEYRTVTINGVTWLAENFAYADNESGIRTRTLSDVNGYDLGIQYYYNLAAARRVADKVNGWHLASMNEWNSLSNYLSQEYSNNNKQAILASTYAWNNNKHGVDLGRMTCLPCGWISSSPALEGQQARFWVSDTDFNRNFYIYYDQLSNDNQDLGWETNKSEGIGMSIRLVKD